MENCTLTEGKKKNKHINAEINYTNKKIVESAHCYEHNLNEILCGGLSGYILYFGWCCSTLWVTLTGLRNAQRAIVALFLVCP